MVKFNWVNGDHRCTRCNVTLNQIEPHKKIWHFPICDVCRQEPWLKNPNNIYKKIDRNSFEMGYAKARLDLDEELNFIQRLLEKEVNK